MTDAAQDSDTTHVRIVHAGVTLCVLNNQMSWDLKPRNSGWRRSKEIRNG